MVPHAGLKYSGGVAGQVWRSIEGLDGRTLLVVSPKHTKAGVNWSVSPFKAWQLSGKVSFDSDRELAKQLAERVAYALENRTHLAHLREAARVSIQERYDLASICLPKQLEFVLGNGR